VHGIPGCHLDGVVVQAEEGIVDNDSRSARSLRNDPHGADPHVPEELFVFLKELVGQDHPKALADKVQELFPKEVRV
jgi:hypothetical protein